MVDNDAFDFSVSIGSTSDIMVVMWFLDIEVKYYHFFFILSCFFLVNSQFPNFYLCSMVCQDSKSIFI